MIQPHHQILCSQKKKKRERATPGDLKWFPWGNVWVSTARCRKVSVKQMMPEKSPVCVCIYLRMCVCVYIRCVHVCRIIWLWRKIWKDTYSFLNLAYLEYREWSMRYWDVEEGPGKSAKKKQHVYYFPNYVKLSQGPRQLIKVRTWFWYARVSYVC